jgi:thymidine phosphorylase
MGPTAVDVIRAKRDGGTLTDEQIDWVLAGYTAGEVADEQMSALAMAILLNGMTPAEIARWTAAMIASGDRLDLSGVGRPTVDKHSTGGVGDKITLPLAPLVASFEVAVPQLSGRGLGHTGGTLDKLEAIPGMGVRLTMPEFVAQLRDVGCAVCAASESLAPADRKLYALRDVTGTVESIPLIASSIMSKKIAEGTGALVLDVKVGSGAFMKDLDRARELARTMVELGGAHGVDTVALLTDMSTPLGYAAGNGIEVAESVEVLAGGGPADVVALTVALAREMLAAAARTGGPRSAGRAGPAGAVGAAALADADPAEALRDGRAMDRWRAMVRAQGGDPDAPLPTAAETELLRAGRDGVVSAMDAYGVGVAAWRAGAGRARKEDTVSPGAGVLLRRRPGDRVSAGDVLAELRADDPARIPAALAELRAAIEIADTAGPADAGPGPLILERVAG